MHDALTRPLRLQIFMDMGIVPLLDAADVRKDVLRALSNLTPEESRIIRRKFRKLWRAEARRVARKLKMRKIGPAELGAPVPTRKAKMERKWMVLMSVMEKEHQIRNSSGGSQMNDVTPF